MRSGLVVVALAAAATPNPHALTLRASDLPAGWSVGRSPTGPALPATACGGTPVRAKASASSPTFVDKATKRGAHALRSFALVYSTAATARRALASAGAEANVRCFERHYLAQARRRIDPKVKLIHAPVVTSSTDASFGFVLLAHRRGMTVPAMYQYELVRTGRTIVEVVQLAVLRPLPRPMFERVVQSVLDRAAPVGSA